MGDDQIITPNRKKEVIQKIEKIKKQINTSIKSKTEVIKTALPKPAVKIKADKPEKESLSKESLEKILSFGLLILVIAMLGIGIFFSSKKFPKRERFFVPKFTPTPSQTLTPTPDINTEWITYTSEYGFEISYPDSWNIKEDKQLTQIALMTVTIYSPDGFSLLDIWVRNGSWEEVKQELDSKASAKTLNGFDALVMEDGEVITYTLSSKKENQIITLGLIKSSKSSDKELELLNRVLSTFNLSK